jgi:hypothetical protein
MTDGAAPEFSSKKRQKVLHGLTLQVHRYADAAIHVNGNFDPSESCYLLALTDSGRPSPLFQLGSKYLPEFVKGHKLEGFSRRWMSWLFDCKQGVAMALRFFGCKGKG